VPQSVRALRPPATLLVVLALATALLAACADDATPDTVGTDGTTEAASALPLEGTAWQLTTLPDGTEPPQGVVATAKLADGTLGGTGGCNSFSAPYELDGDALTFGPAASTMMACAEPIMAVETAYLTALADVATYATTADSLTLSDADGTAVLVFGVAETASLTGTEWQATSINNGKDAVQSLVEGTTATAMFADDGTVSGTGGCNTYSGPATIEGSSLSIGPLSSTQMACPEPAGLSEQEAAFFAALENATTYTIDGSQLELRDDSGALQVSFQAAS
jgi:heat shock protein HslJ